MLLAVLAPALVSCGSAESVQTKVSEHAPAAVIPYAMGPDDEIEVIVWKQPELSGKVVVAADGTVTVPLAGRVQAAGLTSEALEKELNKRLTPFLSDPNVTVRVADARSQAVYILGEVHKPGVFRLRPGEVLSQVLAEAGGFSEFADPSKIQIARRKRSENEEITIDYRKAQSGQDLTADVPLMAGDVIHVP